MFKFNDSVLRDSKQIAVAWGDYFTSLYSDTECDSYDSEHYHRVSNIASNLKGMGNPLINTKDEISLNEVLEAIKVLQKGKICGPDNVYNEHIIFGGTMLHHYLTLLINLMYWFSYIPVSLKYGTIITLHMVMESAKMYLKTIVPLHYLLRS